MQGGFCNSPIFNELQLNSLNGKELWIPVVCCSLLMFAVVLTLNGRNLVAYQKSSMSNL